MITEKKCIQEVQDVNQFLSDWFGGRVDNTDDICAPLHNIFAADFVYVDPAGGRHDRDGLYGFVKTFHGSRGADLEHQLKNFCCNKVTDEILLMTVEELQVASAKIVTHRLCSILFRSNKERPNGVEWFHLHESWIQPPVE